MDRCGRVSGIYAQAFEQAKSCVRVQGQSRRLPTDLISDKGWLASVELTGFCVEFVSAGL